MPYMFALCICSYARKIPVYLKSHLSLNTHFCNARSLNIYVILNLNAC